MSSCDSNNDSNRLSVSSEKQSNEASMLDSASSFHATNKVEWFPSHKAGDFGIAYLGHDTGYRVVGVGDIKIKM